MSSASYIKSEIARLDACIKNYAAALERHGPRGICHHTFEPMYAVQNSFNAAVKKKADLVLALQGLEADV